MALIQMEFKSETLKRTVSANVILPSERFRGPYPTLYLLHGLTDNCNGWLSYTRIRLWAEESGLAVVMPSGENSFYMDILVKDGCLGDFGEYIGRELVSVTREMFPLSHKREDTFLGGLSMGGFGACRNALKYSETFGRICALSTADISQDLELLNEEIPFLLMKPSYITSLLGPLEKIPESDGSLLWLAAHTENKPKIYLACGADDQLLPKTRRLKACLEENGYDLTYRETAGGHEWPFWDLHIKAFIDSLELRANAGLNSGNVGL